MFWGTLVGLCSLLCLMLGIRDNNKIHKEEGLVVAKIAKFMMLIKKGLSVIQTDKPLHSYY
ncbi:hypothetical protein ASG99_14440 [Bacillus sp. Soil768D1]|nr:hypothetical protein ASG99_14440 [Bacillus sp. Soil768D1]